MEEPQEDIMWEKQTTQKILCAGLWWPTLHKDSFNDWCVYRKMTRVWFGHPQVQLIEKYDGRNDPRDHLAKWTEVYGAKPQPEWVHLFSYLGCYTNELVLGERAPPWH